MRRFALSTTSRTVAACAAVAAPAMMAPSRTFFNKGWDNAALDTVFKAVLKKPEVIDTLTTAIASELDPRSLEHCRKLGGDNTLNMYLSPHLGDPHRVLKAYALTAYPILDEKGEPLKIDVEGVKLEAFADPDDDYSKVCIRNADVIELLAKETLAMMNWETTNRGAATFLEALYRGAEIPDHVFQTEALIERF